MHSVEEGQAPSSTVCNSAYEMEVSMLVLTKYLGPTNTKGARIKAHMVTDPKTFVIISYPYECSGSGERHKLAAQALATKFGMSNLQCLDISPSGYYFYAR